MGALVSGYVVCRESDGRCRPEGGGSPHTSDMGSFALMVSLTCGLRRGEE